MENYNWTPIKEFLECHSDCEYEDFKAYPNSYMVALSVIEDWENGGMFASEMDAINEVLDILERPVHRDEWEKEIYELNRRFFYLTEILERNDN